MSKGNLTLFAKSVQKKLSKHAPAIAIGIGIGCYAGAVIAGMKEAPKIERLLNEKREELDISEEEKLPVKEAVKATWKCYITPVASFTLGTVCILGAHRIDGKRNAALAAAYQLSETAFREYKNKVIETIGEKKEESVRHEIARDRVMANPPVTERVIITERGNTLCYDSITGRYFKSDMETIRKLVNDLNYKMESEHYISLNEFFYELGLGSVDLGDILGWNLEHGLIDIDYSSILDPNGTPCLVLNYNPAPRYEYRY